MAVTTHNMNLEYVEADGKWYEIGLAEGRSQHSSVKYTIYRYASYHSESRIWTVLDKATDGVAEFLTNYFPEEWDEMRGIADGAEVDMPLLVAANFPQAIARIAGESKAVITPAREQCSNIMFPSSELGPLLGGTLDDDPLRFILMGRPCGGIDFCCIMWPGWVACSWGGMNSAGLAMCGASATPLLETSRRIDGRIFGLDMLSPVRVVLRSCKTIDEALNKMSQSYLWAGDNYSLMDASGRGVQVYSHIGNSQNLRVVEMPEDRGLCCGNFPLWEINQDDFKSFPHKQDVFSRYLNLKKAVDDNVGRYSVEAMKAVFTNHKGDPEKLESVCNDGTIVAMMAAPTLGRLFFASRPPCVQGFREYTF